ncbi:MAG: hypothetical protein ACYS5V_10335, partial [Planctomycetota bacterium]
CCETIEASLDSLVNVGVILHDGKAPAGGIEACVEALEDVGEEERFDASHAAMKQLTGARDGGWYRVRILREQVVMATQDARRRTGGGLAASLRQLGEDVAAADRAAEATRAAWAGLIEPIWVERYLAERIEPLREELAGLGVRVRELDPVGYGAVVGEG